MSPCLRRLVNNFNMSDTFRSLYPMEAVYSRYYGRAGQEGATRIDRSYTWGEVIIGKNILLVYFMFQSM